MSYNSEYKVWLENVDSTESIHCDAVGRVDYSTILRLDIANTDENIDFIRRNELFFLRLDEYVSDTTTWPNTWVKLLKKNKKCNRAEKKKHAYITFLCRELDNLEILKEADKCH